MPIIKSTQVSKICCKEGQPQFLTRNGHVDTCIAPYDKQQVLIELYQKLAEAESESRSDAPRKSHENLMIEMKARYSK